MKHLLCITILLSSYTANAFFYEQEDKNLHVGASMALTFTISSALLLAYPKISSRKAALLAAGTTLLIGLAKESLYDDRFDINDMEANVLGAAMGSIPFIVIDF